MLFFLATLLLAACHGHFSPRLFTEETDSIYVLYVPTPPPTKYTGLEDNNDALLQAELNYYLERHSVQDEGYEMVANYSQQNDTMLSLLPTNPTTLLNVGHWDGVKRQGTIIGCDTLGNIIIGTCARDSIGSGVRLDSANIYAGDFCGGVAEGHGFRLSDGRLYYEGRWLADEPHGFGFSVAPNSHVRVGEWEHGRYLGERMHYSGERIYGIDISRYQHGKGRKKYPIYWDRLRITHLGKNQKHATGTVDYPVSFIFIKSTESTRIRNPFYAYDYAQARKRGIPIGAYHFFSCRTSGAAQAQYFLNSTLFRHGDLPPVLDVEPTQRQIAAMGGTTALFRQVRAWLSAVERVTHVRPILYVNQLFVNRYLNEAPDLKRNYQIWIARYGEYKPDVKLAVWQLSPNGRVNGIRGEVDINVFNGYHTQFEDFLKNETIRR